MDIEAGGAPESAVSSPPMAMDDPATPGPQGFEVNFVGAMERAGEARATESLFDANYGVGERLQLKFERAYVTTGQVGESSQKGLGATKIGVKWRFLEKGGWQLATYPAYRFNDAFTVKDEEGNAESSEGGAYYLPLIASKAVGRNYTVAANYGFRHNVQYDTNFHFLGFGVGRALGGNGRIMGEVILERNGDFQNNHTEVRVGIAEALFPGWLSRTGLEFPAYIAVGSISEAEETDRITLVTFGITVAKPPKGE